MNKFIKVHKNVLPIELKKNLKKKIYTLFSVAKLFGNNSA